MSVKCICIWFCMDPCDTFNLLLQIFKSFALKTFKYATNACVHVTLVFNLKQFTPRNEINVAACFLQEKQIV